MILQALIHTIYLLIYAVTSPIRLLPDVTMPVGFTNAMEQASRNISGLNNIFPIDTVLTLLKLYIIIEGAYLTYKLIMWLIRRVPTQS